MKPAKLEMHSETPEKLVPINSWKHLSTWQQMLGRVKKVYTFRFLIRQMVKTSITRDYKRSFIGLWWMLITPLLAVVTWVLLQGAGIMNPGETSIPYPAYVLLSTSIWSFFLQSYQVSSNVLINGKQLMVTTDFPHEVLLVEKIIIHLIHFVIPLVLNLVVLVFFGVSFHSWSILFPLTLLPLLCLGVGLGLFVALMRVVAVDFAQIADKVMNFLMFLTPIIYAPKVEVKFLGDIVALNPLTYLIGFSRDLLTNGGFTNLNLYLVFSTLSIIVFLLGFRTFTKHEQQLVERLINV